MTAAAAAERLGYLLATRPLLRRFALIWTLTQVLALWAVAAAPPALAATMAGALDWTGITDSHGVPLGAYYLSVVDTGEAITEAGPGLSADPSTWAQWLTHAVTSAVGHQTVASWLQAQASVYVVMITLALWLLRFAMSSMWLYWLATWFRPLFDAMRQLLADLWVFPLCLTAALAVGAYHILWHGQRGRGWGIMLSSFAIGIIGIALTRDPLTELYSDDGLLNQGRNLGFTVAQAAVNNGSIVPGGSDAQLRNVTTLIADATVRTPLQLWNFGTPVDGIGSCGSAWSSAIMTGEAQAPAHAMPGCGAPQALSYAQQLDGGNAALGVFFCLLGLVFTFFVCYVAYSYVMVAGAAFLNAFLAVPAAALAMIHGRPRRRALRRLVAFFKHALLVFAYVTYISVAALVVLEIAAPGGYAEQVNMTHPVALLVLIALVSAVATGLFRWLKQELGDHTREDLVHTVSELVHGARSGYDSGRRTYQNAQDFRQRGRDRFGSNNTGDPSTDDLDEPLTGAPTAGRPPGGHPPGASGSAAKPRGMTPTAPSTAAQPTASSAGAAATAVAAPEVAVGIAVAQESSRRLHARRDAAPTATSRRPSEPQTTSTETDSAHRQPPAAGRAVEGTAAKTAIPDQRERDRARRDHIAVDDAGDGAPDPGRSRSA